MRQIGCLVACVLAACSAAPSAERYPALAEGYTAASASGAIDAALRFFTVPDHPCGSAPVAASLAGDGPRSVAVGRPITLSAFRVTAHDGSGAALPPVPIAIELDPAAVESLDRLRFQETGELVFRAALRAEVRFRTICQSPEVATGMSFEIEEQ